MSALDKTKKIAPSPLALLTLAIGLALAASLALGGCSLSTSAPSTPTNRYALVIGVQDYPGSGSDLRYPDDDAAEMAATLEAQGWTVKTRLISSSDGSIETDGSPTYDNIKSAIGSLSTDSGATILVYYSGHGSIDSGTGTPYIIPYDGLTTLAGYYDVDKWITPAAMTGWLDAVPAKNRLLILDSCYSGGFSLSDGSVDTSPADYSSINLTTSDKGLLFAALSKFNSMISTNLLSFGAKEVLTLAAAGSEEYSYDDSGHQNGAFTYYLLEAATSGDANGDGYVTVSEAYNYAKKQIKANWNAENWQYDDDFLPHISGGTGDLVLYAGSN